MSSPGPPQIAGRLCVDADWYPTPETIDEMLTTYQLLCRRLREPGGELWRTWWLWGSFYSNFAIVSSIYRKKNAKSDRRWISCNVQRLLNEGRSGWWSEFLKEGVQEIWECRNQQLKEGRKGINRLNRLNQSINQSIKVKRVYESEKTCGKEWIDWLVGWLTCWLTGWLVWWLIDDG